MADAYFQTRWTIRDGYWEWILYGHQECGGACDEDDDACHACWASTGAEYPSCFPEVYEPPRSEDCSLLSGLSFCLCATNYDYSACSY